MNERVKIAVDSFRNGYNCAQSVLVAFSDLTGFKSEDLLNMGSALGGGFCRTRNLCGAVNAVGILYGLITKTDDKAKAYGEMQTMIANFLMKYGSLNCGDLLKGVSVTKGCVPQERTEQYYAERPCERIIEDCVKILQEYLKC